MSSRSSIGFSENTESHAAGAEAARAALEQLQGEKVTVAMLFATFRYVPETLAEGVKSVIGDNIPLIGGCSVGVITSEGLGYDGYQVGVALLVLESGKVDLLQAEGLSDGEFECGADLAQQITQQVSDEEKSCLMFYDAVSQSNDKLQLNMAVPLLEGLSKHMDGKAWQKLVGAGLLADRGCQATYQWLNNDVKQGTASALVFSQGISMNTTVLHGCRPMGDYLTITKAQGPEILEIDGRPALELVGEMLDMPYEDHWKDFGFFVTLGVNHGEKYGEVKDENYQNRLCMRAELANKSLVMFDPDLQAGSEVQLMRRAVGYSYISERIDELFNSIESGKKPFFAFYIDCAGRAADSRGVDEEEAETVVEAIDGRVPLLGLYSGLEIGQIAGQPRNLNYTGVLTVFSE
ncbi:MAG: FIST C-terminal domain-containing protein [Magnetococcales bacterium]|nr:FIST C-terminal domain-containing protein [Magnetococcales bacterium]